MDINHYLKTSKILTGPFPEFGEVPQSPFDLFNRWLSHAFELNVTEPGNMVLGTADENAPDSRIVLLKAIDDKGFYFETGGARTKAKQLNKNTNVALNLYWAPAGRQVRIRGQARLTSDFSHVKDNLDASTRELNVYHIIPSYFEFYQALNEGGYIRLKYTLKDGHWQNAWL